MDSASREHPASAWARRLLSVALSTGLALGMAELAFRLIRLKRLTIPAGIEDPHYHHRLKPNTSYHFTSSEFDVTVQTNRYGLRGPDPVVPKPSGTFRVLMLGDSYTFGFPVKDEETFCQLIQQGLVARGERVEIVNGGVSGYSPTLEYVSLRDQFLTFDPDLVILWYDLGDVQEDAWFQKNLVRDQTGRILRADPRYLHGHFGCWEWLTNHSVLAKYIDTKVLRMLMYARVLGPRRYLETKLRGERAKVALARLKQEQQSDDLASYDRFLLVRPSSTAQLVDRHWALSRQYLILIRDLLAEHGIPFALGIYPYGMVAGSTQWNDGRTFWGFEKGQLYDASVALDLFRRFSTEEHVPLIDTFGSFRAAAAHEKLFYDEDGHFAPAGHRVLAEHVLADPRFHALLRKQANRQNLAPSAAPEAASHES